MQSTDRTGDVRTGTLAIHSYQIDYEINHSRQPKDDSSASNRKIIMRTAFIGLVDNIEFIGDFEIEEHRKEEDSDDERIEKELIQITKLFNTLIGCHSRFSFAFLFEKVSG